MCAIVIAHIRKINLRFFIAVLLHCNMRQPNKVRVLGRMHRAVEA
jgi:hypothetical protein